VQSPGSRQQDTTKVCRGSLLCLCQLPGAPGVPWLVAPSSHSPHSMSFMSLLSVFTQSSSYTLAGQVAFGPTPF
jgi:hypothetical protein